MKNNFLKEKFQEIQNWLFLTEKDIFKWCDTEEERLETILEILITEHNGKKYLKYQNIDLLRDFNTKIVFIEGDTDELSESEIEEMIEQDPTFDADSSIIFYIIKIGDRYFRVNGTYGSWSGEDYDFENILEVDSKFNVIDGTGFENL